MRVLILTTDPTLTKWKSLPAKLAEWDKALVSGKDADFEPTDVKYIDVVPKVVGGRIDHDWLAANNEPYFNQGYDIIALHLSMAQWKQWGLLANLRGSNPVEKQEQENYYFSADENSKRNKLNRFIQTGLHELGHAYYEHTDIPDMVHPWHEANPDITGLFKSFIWSLYQPERMRLKKQLSLLQKVVELLKKLKPTTPQSLLHPVAKYKDYISQPYGVVNKKLYPLSHHHIGTDYACPIGTPVVAPYDGETIVETFSATLGNYIHYQYTYQGQIFVTRFLHLDKAKPTGVYKRGDIIGYSGNTGKVTGAHLHVDVWENTVDIDHINKTNWDTLTVDPVVHYNS